MPYITQDRRDWFDHATEEEIAEEILTSGDLNYLITTLIDEWVADKGLNYSNINEAVGVLECIKLELYRRVAALYEDNKKEQNGDVYTCIQNT